jgi:allene oxide cyclase
MLRFGIGTLVLFVVFGFGTVTTTSAQEATPGASPVALPAQADLPVYEGTLADGMLTLVVIESPVSDTIIDLEPVGDTMGDLLVFANAVYDESGETLVGTDQGWCVRSNPGAGVWECTWTLTLANGQLVVQGPFFDFEETSTLAITGGAGAFLGAEGEMILSATPEGQFMFTYRIIDESA